MIEFILRDKQGSMPRALDLLLDRAGRYARIARLVLSDSLWRFRRRLAALLVLSGASLALQAGALGAFIIYARRLESGTEIAVAGLAVDPTQSVSLLAAAIVVGGILFVLASLSRLYVERGFYDIAWRYGVYCAERMITLASAALSRTGSGRLGLNEAGIREMVTNRPVLCSRVLNRLMNALPLAASLVVFSGFLFYLDPLLTLGIVAIVMVSSIFFYGLSVEVSRFIPKREDKSRAMSADRRLLLDFMKVSNHPLDAEHPLIRDVVRHGSFAAFFAQRFQPQVFAAKSTHVGTITLAIVLTAVGLVKGSEIIATGAGYGDLIVFLVAGRLAMSSAMGIMNTLVRINLYYPRVADYFHMVERLRKVKDVEGTPGRATPRQGAVLQTRSLADRGPAQETRIEPGGRLGVVTPKPLDRFALIDVADGLRLCGPAGKPGKRATPANCWLVPEVPSYLPAASFADVTGLPGGMAAGTLIAELEALGLTADVEAIPDDLAAPLGADQWGRCDPRLLWGAAVVAAGHAGHPIVAVGARTLDSLGESATRAIFERLLADRMLLIAYRPGDAERVGAFGERHLLLYDGEALLGHLLVDETGSRRDLLRGLGREQPAKKPALPDDVLMDEDV